MKVITSFLLLLTPGRRLIPSGGEREDDERVYYLVGVVRFRYMGTAKRQVQADFGERDGITSD